MAVSGEREQTQQNTITDMHTCAHRSRLYLDTRGRQGYDWACRRGLSCVHACASTGRSPAMAGCTASLPTFCPWRIVHYSPPPPPKAAAMACFRSDYAAVSD
eukprot:72859-Chlamydomonas_euryale.AAC.12